MLLLPLSLLAATKLTVHALLFDVGRFPEVSFSGTFILFFIHFYTIKIPFVFLNFVLLTIWLTET